MIEFNPDFARQYGVIEAIVFERLKVLQLKNKENYQNYYLDSYWVDLNSKIYNRFLYFLPMREMDYALENLVKRNIVKILQREDIIYYSINDKHLN